MQCKVESPVLCPDTTAVSFAMGPAGEAAPCYNWNAITCPRGEECRYKAAHIPGQDTRQDTRRAAAIELLKYKSLATGDHHIARTHALMVTSRRAKAVKALKCTLPACPFYPYTWNPSGLFN